MTDKMQDSVVTSTKSETEANQAIAALHQAGVPFRVERRFGRLWFHSSQPQRLQEALRDAGIVLKNPSRYLSDRPQTKNPKVGQFLCPVEGKKFKDYYAASQHWNKYHTDIGPVAPLPWVWTLEGAFFLRRGRLPTTRELDRNPVHPQALESLKRYKADLKAGHTDAAEYWRGQAAAYFTANPSDYHIKKVPSRYGKSGFRVTKGKGVYAEFIGEYSTRQDAREAIRKWEERERTGNPFSEAERQRIASQYYYGVLIPNARAKRLDINVNALRDLVASHLKRRGLFRTYEAARKWATGWMASVYDPTRATYDQNPLAEALITGLGFGGGFALADKAMSKVMHRNPDEIEERRWLIQEIRRHQKDKGLPVMAVGAYGYFKTVQLREILDKLRGGR